MLKLLWIAGGGAAGTLLRYFVSGLDYRFSNGVFPVGTLAVNLIGSLAIGFLWGLFEHVDVSPQARMFALMGILGGFTTFSTFSLETFNLFRDGEFRIAFLNILLTNAAGIAFVFIGFILSRHLISFFK